jgi:hypothetical protein
MEFAGLMPQRWFVSWADCNTALRSYLLALNADSPVLAAKLAFTPP